MNIAVISDIHGNLEALESVLGDIKRTSPDAKIVCLGDLVGYGADPNACIDVIIKNSVETIAGNHDHAALNLINTISFNLYAKAAIEWTAQKLTSKNKAFLKSLPYVKELENITLAHSTPQNPSEWNYLTNFQDAVINFKHFNTTLCFIGHTHIPKVYTGSKINELNIYSGDEFTFKKGEKALINVGSVGQPRDKIAKACYAIADLSKLKVKFRRVVYDIDKTAKKMAAAGLPPFLYERLRLGR